MPVVWTLLLNLPLGLAGWLVARHGFRQPPGLPRGLAATTLAWSWAVVGMEILGASGYLARGPLLAWVVLGLAIGSALRAWRPGGDDPATTQAPAWSWDATLAVTLVIWPSLSYGVYHLYGPVSDFTDAPIYHLYFAVRWWKAGALFLVPTPFGDNATSYFPCVGELGFDWLLAGWGGERLAKVGQAPFLLIAALAAFATARRLGAGTSAAVIATAWFVGTTNLLSFSVQPNVDTVFVAGYLLAVYFFLRHGLGDGGAGDLALGGLASGAALGAKPTGVVFVPVLLALAALVVLRRRASRGQALRDLFLLAACPLLLAGYWYGRNAWLTGNPLYPLRVELLGREVLSGWFTRDAMRASPFYQPVTNVVGLLRLLNYLIDIREAPFWLLSACGVWAWGASRRDDRTASWTGALGALAIANVALFWLLIPYRFVERFLFHAIGLAVAPLARTLDRARWLRVLGLAVLALHVLTPQPWPFRLLVPRSSTSWWALVLKEVPPLVTLDLPALVPAGSLGLCALVVAWAWGRSGRYAAAVAIALSVLTVFGVGHIEFYQMLDHPGRFYPNNAHSRQGWLDLENRIGPSGARVAYAGTNQPYYLFGRGLRNDVRYVNVDAHRDWLMHDYHRAAKARGQGTWPDPRVNWSRLEPDYDAWLANLRAAQIQVLVVAAVHTFEGTTNVADEARFPVERQWAESHPADFTPLYGVAEQDLHFRAYRVLPARPGPGRG